MNILIVIPSTRTQCQGISAVSYAQCLRNNGHNVFLLYHLDRLELERNAPDKFLCVPMRWEGRHLATDIKKKVSAFSPDIVHVWDMWSHGLAAALECVVVSNARLIMHQEDDQLAVWKKQKGREWNAKPFKSIFAGIHDKSDILALIKASDLNRYFIPDWVPQKPDFDPFLFFLASRIACAFTAIWHPMKKRLEKSFEQPVLLLPPGFDPKAHLLNQAQVKAVRQKVLTSLNAPSESLLLGAGGSIRHFDNELSALLQAFRTAAKQDPKLFLAIWGFDTHPFMTGKLIRHYGLSNRVSLLGAVDDATFIALQQAADIHVCTGYDSVFNTYRLPSRLCRLFLLGKPLLLHRAGFGKSLKDRQEAVLTYTNQASEWAEKILLLTHNGNLRKRLSHGARRFAKRHFDIKTNTAALIHLYESVLAREQASDLHSQVASRLRSRLEDSGAHRIVLYGAGLHTQRLIRQGWLSGFKTVAILDDAPRSSCMESIPVLDARQAHLPAWDVLIISSDSYEQTLLKKSRARGWKNVWTMYS